MKLYKVKVLVLGFTLFLGLLGQQVLAETNAADTAELFEVYKDKVYQVRTINRATDAKSAIGSSFQITADGLMVTNFHVVSDYVHDREINRLEYINSNGDKGELEVIAVDVINDLALVKHTSQYSAHFNLSNSLPTQGDAIYSLGNPHDVGLTVVPGVYNGYIENSYYERLHFTGSLNGGVSGGPVINGEGKVIGVNVASSGNQLSYLVPLDKVKSLLAREEQASVISLEKSIQLQLDDHQKRIMDDLMMAKWPRVSMGDATVYGELQPYILCWDSSEEAKKGKLYQFNKTSCSNSDYIYLSKDLESGEYQFFYYWLESEHL
ncbi:MAG: trypsin-like peptidase domain-containing protein, partial [Gammaproteobacteria bacterium]|nr:trypsin-like peptidase domain-containing protein [Gammaproteobacteria bacterium]